MAWRRQTVGRYLNKSWLRSLTLCDHTGINVLWDMCVIFRIIYAASQCDFQIYVNALCIHYISCLNSVTKASDVKICVVHEDIELLIFADTINNKNL